MLVGGECLFGAGICYTANDYDTHFIALYLDTGYFTETLERRVAP